MQQDVKIIVVHGDEIHKTIGRVELNLRADEKPTKEELIEAALDEGLIDELDVDFIRTVVCISEDEADVELEDLDENTDFLGETDEEF